MRDCRRRALRAAVLGAFGVLVLARDSLSGVAGADRLAGAGGDDTLAGGRGDDVLAGGPGNDRERGGLGRDRFDQGAAADGGDRLDGGPGSDTVDYRGRSAKLSVGRAAGDGAKGERDNVLKTVEVVFAGSGADRLTAGLKGAALHGGHGNDVQTGGAGRDYLDGGGGADTARRVGVGDRVLSCRIS
jgi:Ca2+-binding RTX toxin-like protein